MAGLPALDGGLISAFFAVPWSIRWAVLRAFLPPLLSVAWSGGQICQYRITYQHDSRTIEIQSAESLHCTNCRRAFYESLGTKARLLGE